MTMTKMDLTIGLGDKTMMTMKIVNQLELLVILVLHLERGLPQQGREAVFALMIMQASCTQGLFQN